MYSKDMSYPSNFIGIKFDRPSCTLLNNFFYNVNIKTKNGYVLMHPAFVSHCIVDWSQKIGYLSQHGEVNMQCKQKT